VSTPYSGNGKGQLFTPEVGSQVLVGYEQSQAEFPLVLGNLFHPQNPQQATYTTPQNHLKGLQTAGGNKVVMSDAKDAQTILISNSNNKGTALQVSFAGDGSITIKSNGPISLLAGGDITLDSKKDIILTAGNNVTITAQKNVLLTTKEEAIALDAKQTLDLVAEDLTADFRNNLSMTASAQAKIKSQDTDII
jgi:type VI secretion system secreted protein VgrG